MFTLKDSFLLTLLIIFLPSILGTRCLSCGDQCDECEYGNVYSKTCEFNVCYKAPGDDCGYVDMDDRLCAEGSYCKHGKCQGCSITPFKCYVDLEPFVESTSS